MKKVMVIGLIVTLLIAVATTPALAAKPQDVIAYSNGFPSGLHFNLNIHGKDPTTFTCPGPGGNSVFIPEYTSDYESPTTISYISDKRNNGLYELLVTDPCAMPDPYGDGDGAEVKIPWHVMTDEGDVIEVSGYYVFARILGKPNHGKPKNGDPSPSSMILYPNIIVDAENDDTSTMPLGLITQRATYVAAPEGFVRFDPEVTKGKGKSKAKDITHLFTWSGWVVWGEDPDLDDDNDVDSDDLLLADLTNVPDIDGNSNISVEEWILYHPDTDGSSSIDDDDVNYALTLLDVILDEPALSTWINTNLDTDGIVGVTVDEWLQYQATLGHAQEFNNEWIFNIADYVVTEQQIDNDGTKLLQIRFYPIETTEYTKPARIVVGKLTDPAGSEDDFTFDASYLSENIILRDNEAFISDVLTPDSYSITEILPDGWMLSDVTIIEDIANSSGWTADTTVEIKLDAEETVYVTFTNTQME
jgi:hypothetical protein